jgi:hypothetical protein
MRERSQKYKGKYTPEHPAKYMGDTTNIIYRSMWERRCMKYFDVNPSVLQWASEEVVIPYYDSMSKKVRKYFPDFLIKVKTANGETKTHLIEVKPSKDLRPPVGGRGKKKSTVLYEMKSYRMNRDKFASARKWCDERGIIFDVWTEKHLKQKG